MILSSLYTAASDLCNPCTLRSPYNDQTYDEASFHAGPEPSLYPPLFENQYFDRNQTSVLISSKTLFLEHDRLNAELRFDNYLGSDRVSEDVQIQMCGEFTLDFKSNTDASVRPEYRCFQMSPTSRGSVLQGELTAEEAWGPPLKLIRNFVLTAYKYQTQYRGLRAWVVTRAFADAEYQYSRLVRPLPALPTSRSQDRVAKLQLLGQNQTEAGPVNDARTKDSRTREGEEALESAAQSAHVLPKGAAQRNFLTDRTEAKEGETEPQQMEDVETEVETPLLEGSGDRGWDSRGKL